MEFVIATPTTQIYGALEQAYRFFNSELFEDQLPPALLTLQHKGKRTPGYYAPERFTGRKTRRRADELALNPAHFTRPLEETLATLVHQMVHLWQQHHDIPSRAGYHNKHWASKMKLVGLHPSDTGEAGGKETGQHMSHYLVAGGKFQASCHRLLKTGFDVVWAEAIVQSDAPVSDSTKAETGRVAWQCPQCNAKAWSKPSVLIVCGICRVDFVRR